MIFIAFLAGVFVGVLVGVLAMALLFVSRRADDAQVDRFVQD